MQPWKRTQSERLLENPYINVRRDECELPGGRRISDYYVVEEADYGVVFALTPHDEVVMVRQYKHGIGAILLELPAGYFDHADEDPAAACLREFREETGYTVSHYQLAAAFVRHPSRMNNRGHLVIASGAHPAGNQKLDANEDIEVILLPIETALTRVQSGQIDAVGTVAALYFGWDFVQRQRQANRP